MSERAQTIDPRSADWLDGYQVGFADGVVASDDHHACAYALAEVRDEKKRLEQAMRAALDRFDAYTAADVRDEFRSAAADALKIIADALDE